MRFYWGIVDRFTRQERSRIMARVKGRDTAPERIVRSIVHRLGFRFRLHVRSMHGTPDIVLARHRKVILVHGCFWHGHTPCPRGMRPQSNVAFWEKKLSGNIERDKRIRRALSQAGWRSLVIWECQVKDEMLVIRKLRRFLCGPDNRKDDAG